MRTQGEAHALQLTEAGTRAVSHHSHRLVQPPCKPMSPTAAGASALGATRQRRAAIVRQDMQQSGSLSQCCRLAAVQQRVLSPVLPECCGPPQHKRHHAKLDGALRQHGQPLSAAGHAVPCCGRHKDTHEGGHRAAYQLQDERRAAGAPRLLGSRRAFCVQAGGAVAVARRTFGAVHEMGQCRSMLRSCNVHSNPRRPID